MSSTRSAVPSLASLCPARSEVFRASLVAPKRRLGFVLRLAWISMFMLSVITIERVWAATEWVTSKGYAGKIRDAVLDRVLGPPDDFEYQGSTTPE
jgi:hypothetical protein